MRAFIFAIILFCATFAGAQWTPGPGDCVGVNFYDVNNNWLGCFNRVTLTNDFAGDNTTTPGNLILQTGPLISHFEAYVGDVPEEFAAITRGDGRRFDHSAGTLHLPCSASPRGTEALTSPGTCTTSVPTSCRPGETWRRQRTSATSEQVCTCAANTCTTATQTTDCGTGGACSSGFCTTGTTAGKFLCRKTSESIFGDGLDGVFYMPTPTADGSLAGTGDDNCLTYSSTPDLTTGAVCPSAFCASCSNVTAGNPSAGCICALTTNSRLGTADPMTSVTDTSTSSVIRRFSSVTIGNKNRITVNRTPSNACGTPVGSVLWFKVTGDMMLTGGTGGSKIDMKGKGACGGTSGGTLSASAGSGGCGTIGAGAGGAAGGKNNGTGGTAWTLDWFPGYPETVFLWGAGGQKGNVSGATSCGLYNYISQGMNGIVPSGGAGSCVATASSACGASGTPGNGGGGVILDVGGTLTLDTNSSIDVSATDSSGNNVGGAGAGRILLRYNILSDTASGTHYVENGGAGGTSCGSGSGAVVQCGSGGSGANGDVTKVAIP